jgi:5'-deoxynucleotidase YfbR-like HD superfamily hydrolase
VVKPRLSPDARRHQRCNKAMQIAMRLNIKPAEVMRRQRQKRREERKARQQDRIDTAIDNCGTEAPHQQFDAQWMMRD